MTLPPSHTHHNRPCSLSSPAPDAPSVAWLLTLWVVVAAGVMGCQPTKRTRIEEKLAELELTPEEAKQILAELSTKRAERGPPPQPFAQTAPPSERVAQAPTASLETTSAPKPDGGWIVDEIEDIAPAAPSSAAAKGVFLVNGGNELFLAKLGAQPPSPNPGPSVVGVVPDSVGPFALGRGPSFTERYAYWVTSHFLLRRPIEPPYGPLEVIAEDARVGTRPSTVNLKPGSFAVAYIALPKIKDGPLRARLWLETQPPRTAVDITDSGNSTLSVALVSRRDRAQAISLEARMGVTALHSRGIDRATGALGVDEVVWIGGTAQPLTEVRALSKPHSHFTFMAMEQDSSHFGLAVLNEGPTARELTETWLTFPNGLDPAPVAATSACGKDLVLFARPSEPTPKAPQELVLAELIANRLDHGLVLSRARAYYDVSIAALPKGALVSFVADHRTWAQRLRCVGPALPKD